MNETELLERFEDKYKFLYEEMVNGVPLYTCLRDDVLLLLQGGRMAQASGDKKGRVYVRRMLDGIIKLRRLRKAKTLIFTSAVYRRDHGRNLAAEYLMDRYPDAVVFEWPSRNEDFDSAYFSDPQRDRYCPLDVYLVWYKALSVLSRKKLHKREEELRGSLREKFAQAPAPENENEQAAVDLVVSQLPASCVATSFSQGIFRRMFRRYTSVEYAIDFWGSGRENIFPVLPGRFEKVELQHGIITSFHPGYIYPSFVKDVNTDFFQRGLLVYGKATKRLLIEKSIFSANQIEVVGNPRINLYKRINKTEKVERHLVLFTSQPLQPIHSNGVLVDYYEDMIEYLKIIQHYLKSSTYTFELAIKLHPREGSDVAEKYKRELDGCGVYDASSQLYDLFAETFLHITVASTTLYEAAEFGIPTILIDYGNVGAKQRYGFDLIQARETKEIAEALDNLMVDGEYGRYVAYLEEQAKEYM